MDHESNKQSVFGLLAVVLDPIIRLLLKVGVTWKEFAELAKERYVVVATEDYGIRGRPTNASRVAILTGIDRGQVRRMRRGSDEPPARGYQSKASQVLAGWHHDPDFLGSDGAAAVLPIDGDGQTFAELMRRYAPALPPVAMVKELKAAGTIEELPDGRLRAVSRTYVPVGLPAEFLRLWSSGLSDLANTIEHNFNRDDREPARFQRRALNLRIQRSALPEFRELLEREAQALLVRIDDWLSAHEAAPTETDAETMRLGVGVYHIEDRKTRRIQKKRQGNPDHTHGETT